MCTITIHTVHVRTLRLESAGKLWARSLLCSFSRRATASASASAAEVIAPPTARPASMRELAPATNEPEHILDSYIIFIYGWPPTKERKRLRQWHHMAANGADVSV